MEAISVQRRWHKPFQHIGDLPLTLANGDVALHIIFTEDWIITSVDLSYLARRLYDYAWQAGVREVKMAQLGLMDGKGHMERKAVFSLRIRGGSDA